MCCLCCINCPSKLAVALHSSIIHVHKLAVMQEFGSTGGQWHGLAYSKKTNAAVQTEPQGDFELCCGLLIPLYAARATEEVFYGKQGVTLGTAQEVCSSAQPSVCSTMAWVHYQLQASSTAEHGLHA